MGSHWIDNLDIPEIPDFADPKFNPYAYDGADGWFADHRETETTESIQAIITKTQKPPSESVPSTISHSSDNSSLDEQSSEGLSNQTFRADRTFSSKIPEKLMAPEVSHQIPAASKPIKLIPPVNKPSQPGPSNKANSTFVNNSLHSNGPLVRPLQWQKQAFNSTFMTKNLSKSAPRGKPATPPAKPKNPVNKLVAAVGKLHLSPHMNRRTEIGSRLDDHPKKSPVVAARAEEYFIHTLRQYPDEGKPGPYWK